MILDKQNNLKEVEFVVEGRKIPLQDIRERTLKKHMKYTRFHDDNYYDDMPKPQVISKLAALNELKEGEGVTSMRCRLKTLERTRHLKVWHDHSIVANHGHLVFMVAASYDPAHHLTPEEYKAKTGESVDIQTIIEKPEIYIIAR